MPRPSRKKTGDVPTSNDAEDLACQGKLPRNTTIAEDITVAPRSASKISPLKTFDGDEANVRASSSKTDEAKSEKSTRKKRAAPDTTLSGTRSSALRSSRKRAGDFNDVDGGEFENVAIDDTPTETKSTKPSKKRKTAKSASENLHSIAPADHEAETEKIFPGGDRVEVEPATSSKRGRKPGKRVEKPEALPTESAKPSRKPTGSKNSEKPLDGGKQPATSDDRDEELADVTKDQPKRRGRPRKSQVESKSDELSAEPIGLQKSISANEATQNLAKTGKSRKSSTKESTTKEPASKESTSKVSASKASASKEPAVKEPVLDDTVTKKPVTKEPLKKEPAKKEAAKKESAKKESTKKESATKESATKESAKKEPAKKDLAKKDPPKKEPAQQEPPKKESTKKEPAKREPAKKESKNKEPSQEEPTKNEPATTASNSKASISKASASKASISKASASRVPATKKSATEQHATEEPVTEKPTTQEPVIEEPDTGELAATKPASKLSKRANKGEKAGKAADVEAPATIKASRGRKENKATIIAESSKDGQKPKVSKKASDSSKKDDATNGMHSKSNEAASSSKDVGPVGTEAPEQAGKDGKTSGAANSKKRKTPPVADSDAIRKVIDPLTELESSKKKQKKGSTPSLEAAKTKIGDIVSPIVDTVTQGVHTAKDLAAEVQSSILEDISAVAEEAADAKLDEAETVKEAGVPVVKNGKDKGKEKGKERVTALSKETEPAQTSAAEGVALKAPEVDLGTKKQDVLGYQQDIEMTDQPLTNPTGLDDGTKESANIAEVPREHPRRSHQATVVEVTEVTGISTVCTTVVQGGQP